MPISVSQHRASVGAYHKKLHDNLRGKSNATKWISANHPTILEVIRRVGSHINRAANSCTEMNSKSYQTAAPQQGTIALMVQLLSQVSFDVRAISATTAPPSFSSEGSLSPSVFQNTAYLDNNINDFSTMLNPVANALYKTCQFIARHDPLKFPASEAATLPLTGTEAVGAVDIVQDLKSDSYIIKKEQKKNEVIASLVQYFVSNGQLTADEGKDAELRLRSEAAGMPIVITPLYNEEPDTSRAKRALLAENNPQTAEHIKEHCAFEEEVLDTEGENLGKILLFQAQRDENPFRRIWDNHPDHGPSPSERGLADGLNIATDIITLGLKPLIGSLLANAKRTEYYGKKGDRICAERFRKINNAEFLTFVDEGGLSYNAGKVGPRVAKPVELRHTLPSPRRAAFYTRNPHSQVRTEILLELKQGKAAIDDNGRKIYLKPTKKPNEFVTYHPDAPRPDLIEKRVIVDETNMSWRYADSFDSSNLNVRVFEGKKFIELKGDFYKIQKNYAGGYEIVVPKESGVKELIPVYMEPLSKKWHLSVYNEHPSFSGQQADRLNQLQAETAKGFDYIPRENTNPKYYGNGKIYYQRQSGDYYGYTFGSYVEMNGKLVPLRHTQHKGSGTLYEVYDLKNPIDQGHPIEWDGERWLFERQTSVHIDESLEQLISEKAFAKTINVSDLSSPNHMGIRIDTDGNKYIKIKDNFVQFFETENNRFIIKDGSEHYLVEFSNDVRTFNVIKKDDISPEFDEKLIINCDPLPRAKRSLPPCAPSPAKSQPNSATGKNGPTNSKTAKVEQKISTITRLQHKQRSFEKAVERFPACDVKTQELLKFLRKDKELWKDLDGKLEVRVIKTKDEGKEIVLHPEGEEKARWSGKYHVYLTVNNEDKRLVIDPYIGGDKSCAHVDEQDFIKSTWEGEEGKEYVLETIAPTKEVTKEDGSYTPEFSIKDYMENLFDPILYESHKFYYDNTDTYGISG